MTTPPSAGPHHRVRHGPIRGDGLRQREAEPLGERGFREQKRALKVLAAVQARGKGEMAIQQRAGIDENPFEFGRGDHGGVHAAFLRSARID